MTRAGRWLRVSSGRQDEASQEPEVDRWIAGHGYETAETYRVHGASAYHGKHEPELRRAMADLKAGRIEVLVVWKSDRLERRGAHALMGLIAEAVASGGRIEFVTEPALNNASDPIAGPMLQAFYGAMGKAESETKRDRTRIKQAALRAAGSYSSGGIPYGYTLVARDGRKVLEPDAGTAPVVKRIFESVAGGQTLRQVALALTAEKVPCPNGAVVWAEGVIARIVRRPAYRGQVTYQGRAYATCEPLVSSAVWLQAGKVVSARANTPGNGGGRKPSVLLRPECARCGAPMYPHSGRRYYRCAGWGPSGNSALRKGCGNTIRLDLLDAEVTSVFLNDDEPEVTETVIPGTDHAEDIAQVQLAIRDLDVMADDYDAEHSALMAELRRLRALPAEPERRESVRTGRTYGDAFRAMTYAERQAHLRRWPIRVYPKDAVPSEVVGLSGLASGRRWLFVRQRSKDAAGVLQDWQDKRR